MTVNTEMFQKISSAGSASTRLSARVILPAAPRGADIGETEDPRVIEFEPMPEEVPAAPSEPVTAPEPQPA